MFILASSSPRRQELLQMMGCSFTVCGSNAEEAESGGSPEEIALGNAGSKAVSVAARHPGVPVLGADTVVALGEKIYGKPRDEADAVSMLQSLSGRTHLVVTGVAFAIGSNLVAEAAVTRVRFGSMSEEEIAAYVSTGEPMDKAGAYALQGRAEAFIRSIHGSWSNVVGLPLYLVRRLAEKAGVDLYGDDHGEGSARG